MAPGELASLTGHEPHNSLTRAKSPRGLCALQKGRAGPSPGSSSGDGDVCGLLRRDENEGHVLVHRDGGTHSKTLRDGPKHEGAVLGDGPCRRAGL